jgi:hypothetical protein
MPAHSEHYWVGHLSMTVAEATRSPNPQPILKSALNDFLKDRPADDKLGTKIRQTLKEKR